MGGKLQFIQVNHLAVSVGCERQLIFQRIDTGEGIVELALTKEQAIQLELAIHEAVEQLGQTTGQVQGQVV